MNGPSTNSQRITPPTRRTGERATAMSASLVARLIGCRGGRGATGARAGTGTAFAVPQNVHLHGLSLLLTTSQTIAQNPQVQKVIRKGRKRFPVSCHVPY